MELYSVCGSEMLIKEEEANYLQMDKIMKRLFMLENKRPIIDFLNAIYKGNISYDAKLSYGNREINNISGEYLNICPFTLICLLKQRMMKIYLSMP